MRGAEGGPQVKLGGEQVSLGVKKSQETLGSFLETPGGLQEALEPQKG